MNGLSLRKRHVVQVELAILLNHGFGMERLHNKNSLPDNPQFHKCGKGGQSGACPIAAAISLADLHSAHAVIKGPNHRWQLPLERLRQRLLPAVQIHALVSTT